MGRVCCPPPGEIRRAIVIVNLDWAQTVDGVLRARGITATPPDSAKSLILELPGAAIYSVVVSDN
jgi:hypothetical protein